MNEDLAGRRVRVAKALAEARQRAQPMRDIPRVLAVAGAILIQLGFASMGLAWYGASRTPYTFEQLPYLMSGGLVGLGLVVTGCGAYVGAWVLRLLDATREQTRELARFADRGAAPDDGAAGDGAANVRRRKTSA